MSIDAVTSASCSSRWAGVQKIKQDLQSLQGDLQSGNISTAQTDFATLLDDAPGLKARLQNGASSTSATSATGGSGALSTQSTALQSGDVSGAQTAFASLQQSLGGAHHHHHHHEGSGAANSGASPNFQAVTTDLQSLAGALESGNLTAAQGAFAQLQTDDPRLAGSLSPATPVTPTASAS